MSYLDACNETLLASVTFFVITCTISKKKMLYNVISNQPVYVADIQKCMYLVIVEI